MTETMVSESAVVQETAAFWSQAKAHLALALAEDLASGDLTARCTVPADLQMEGRLLAKQDLRMCGLPLISAVLAQLDPSAVATLHRADGEDISAGEVVATIRGSARSLLAAERTILNYLQRLSGIATLARGYVRAAEGKLRITDTRKTTPGLRMLERYAVRCGGAFNHRNDLGSAVLIKENHIRCAGSVGAAVRAARRLAPHGSKIECEVTNLHELGQALDAGADVIMLDNFSDDLAREAVAITSGRAILELSGGITLERIAALVDSGVGVISVGALTHSAPAVDLSLKLFAIG